MDRFKIRFHYEDRPVDAQTLVTVKPKLTKADPSGRTGCTRQSPPRMGRGYPLRLVCQNITMAEFAEQLQGFDSQIFYPVLDGTGLDGAWDFILDSDVMANLSPLPLFAGRGPGAVAGEASEPSSAVSLAVAIEKQLGLKLEKRKRPVNVLVLDHIEEKATEN